MSDYSSVILAFQAPHPVEMGVERPHEGDADARSRASMEAAFARLASDHGFRIDDTVWAHGLPQGDAYCCETVVRFSINYFFPADFWPAVYRVAPWLRAMIDPPQAWYKAECDDAYQAIPISPEVQP